MGRLAAAYIPRRPTETALYALVRDHLETFVAFARERYERGLPRYGEDELRAYLKCGVFSEGFIRARCDGCGHDLLVAFTLEAAQPLVGRTRQSTYPGLLEPDFTDFHPFKLTRRSPLGPCLPTRVVEGLSDLGPHRLDHLLSLAPRPVGVFAEELLAEIDSSPFHLARVEPE